MSGADGAAGGVARGAAAGAAGFEAGAGVEAGAGSAHPVNIPPAPKEGILPVGCGPAHAGIWFWVVGMGI